MDEIADLYVVADEGETATLDDLRRRAGVTWDHWGCWTNLDEETHCQRCGMPRVEIPEAAPRVA